MTSLIPPRTDKVKDESVRFYVVAPKTVKVELMREAVARGVDLYDLGGAVLSSWLAAGCPDLIPASPSSSSPLADDQGGDK